MTLRGRFPILLSELMTLGYRLNFYTCASSEITISWSRIWYVNKERCEISNHVHLPWEDGVHGANMLLMEKVLSGILESHDENVAKEEKR
jgi:protein-tyrosine phosphatase